MANVGWLNGKTDGGYRLLSEARGGKNVAASPVSTPHIPGVPSIHEGCKHMNGKQNHPWGRRAI
jgi:hypothetical protein